MESKISRRGLVIGAAVSAPLFAIAGYYKWVRAKDWGIADWDDQTVYFPERVHYWRDEPIGYDLRRDFVEASQKTGVFLVAGQSNGAAYGSGPPVALKNPDGVDSFSAFNGKMYEGKDPGPNIDGGGISWLYRFADRLISQGFYQRVIMVPLAMGSARADYYLPGAVLGNFIPVAIARLTSLGIPISGVLWQQGESDGGAGTPKDQYVQTLNSIISRSRQAGLSAPWFIGKSTYQSGKQNDVIREACAYLVNNRDILPGADTDVLTGEQYRSEGLTHFNGAGLDAAAGLWLSATVEGLHILPAG